MNLLKKSGKQLIEQEQRKGIERSMEMTREEAIEQLEFMLEQMPEEPPTECDYIDEWLDTNRKTRNAFEMAIKALEQEPTRKKGKWIYHEKSISTGFKDLRECSCCKCYFDWIMPRNSYCPNCGAEMESEE